MIVESLAGTGRRYVQLQARLYPKGLHVQGEGNEVNRSYGVAETFPINPELRAYLEKVEAEAGLSSLAGTGKKYFPLQAVLNRAEGQMFIHFQVPFKEAYNREYGAAFDVPIGEAPYLAVFIASELQYTDC